MKFHDHAKQSSEAGQLPGIGGEAVPDPDDQAECSGSSDSLAIMHVQKTLVEQLYRAMSFHFCNTIHERKAC